MKTFYLYFHNNPVAQSVFGEDVCQATKAAGISNDRLNQFLAFWSEGDTMQWDSSDTGCWVSKRR